MLGGSSSTAPLLRPTVYEIWSIASPVRIASVLRDRVTLIGQCDHKMLSASDRIVWIRDGRVDRIEDRSDITIEVGTIEGME